jgi:hypothetical protein
VVAALAGFGPFGASAQASGPVTLVRSSQFIEIATGAGGRLGWVQSSGNHSVTCHEIRRKLVGRRRSTVLTRWCEAQRFSLGASDIAVAGRRVTASSSAAFPELVTWFTTASDPAPVQRFLYESECDPGICGSGQTGTEVGPIAGSSLTTVVGITEVAAAPVCPNGCAPVVTGGRVVRLVADASGHVSRVRVPGAPAPALLAVAAHRIADVPLQADGRAGSLIEVRDVATGAVTSSVTVSGVVRAVALTRTTIIAEFRNAQHVQRIAWYAVSDGHQIGHTAPLSDPVPIAADGDRLVFGTHKIRLLNLVTGATRQVWNPVGPVAELALDGRLIVVHVAFSSTIEGLRLPA